MKDPKQSTPAGRPHPRGQWAGPPAYTNSPGGAAPYTPPPPKGAKATGHKAAGKAPARPGAAAIAAGPKKPWLQWGGGVALLLIGLSVVVVVASLLYSLLTVGTQLSRLLAPAGTRNNPPQNSFSVIYVVGTIQSASNDVYATSSSSYHHSDTVAHIKALAENEGNKGILLYMNTSGGGVYESDEVYMALEAYKTATERPVWAYMANTCASGGYYITAAADHIACNRNTTTGSIGVYIALTDTSGLYEKLGIETVLVKSGDNKGVGMEGVPITEEQRAVYQSMVDEYYEHFIALVAEGRGLPLETVRPLADGRVYTGQQALELDLVDELSDWDTLLEAFEEETGATPYYTSFSRQSQIARLVGGLLGELPKSDAEAMLDAAEGQPAGVPMMLYQP